MKYELNKFIFSKKQCLHIYMLYIITDYFSNQPYDKIIKYISLK